MKAYNSLRNAYYDKLEQLGIEYREHHVLDNSPENYLTETVVQDKYAEPDAAEMCDTLGMSDWVKQWALDVIQSEIDALPQPTAETCEEIDTCTEYNKVKFTNNFKYESKIL